MYKGILTIGIVLAFVFGTSYYFTSYKTNSLFEDNSNNPIQKENVIDQATEIGNKINRTFYYNYETKHPTRLYFSFFGNPNSGSCIFNEGSFTDDSDCAFTYSYTIKGNEINAIFISSDCEGRTTTDRIFYYDEERDIISTLVNGETFEFARIDSPFLKRGNHNDLAQPTQSSSNESGYSVGNDERVYENAPCSLCGGTGIEKAINSMGRDRICPQCEGRGHQSY